MNAIFRKNHGIQNFDLLFKIQIKANSIFMSFKYCYYGNVKLKLRSDLFIRGRSLLHVDKHEESFKIVSRIGRNSLGMLV